MQTTYYKHKKSSKYTNLYADSTGLIDTARKTTKTPTEVKGGERKEGAKYKLVEIDSYIFFFV